MKKGFTKDERILLKNYLWQAFSVLLVIYDDLDEVLFGAVTVSDVVVGLHTVVGELDQED